MFYLTEQDVDKVVEALRRVGVAVQRGGSGNTSEDPTLPTASEVYIARPRNRKSIPARVGRVPGKQKADVFKLVWVDPPVGDGRYEIRGVFDRAGNHKTLDAYNLFDHEMPWTFYYIVKTKYGRWLWACECGQGSMSESSSSAPSDSGSPSESGPSASGSESLPSDSGSQSDSFSASDSVSISDSVSGSSESGPSDSGSVSDSADSGSQSISTSIGPSTSGSESQPSTGSTSGCDYTGTVTINGALVDGCTIAGQTTTIEIQNGSICDVTQSSGSPVDICECCESGGSLGSISAQESELSFP